MRRAEATRVGLPPATAEIILIESSKLIQSHVIDIPDADEDGTIRPWKPVEDRTRRQKPHAQRTALRNPHGTAGRQRSRRNSYGKFMRRPNAYGPYRSSSLAKAYWDVLQAHTADQPL